MKDQSAPLYRTIEACRICGSTDLVPVVSLGEQALTGVFPRTKNAALTRGPLELVQCSGGDGSCGLVQLRHRYEPGELYGPHYGYRSSLNRSMVEHLGNKVRALLARRPVGKGDVVLDIGSNDGTTLSFYPSEATLIGIDPTSAIFAKYYKPHIKSVPDFFSRETFLRASGGQHARIVTSIAMFYDLDHPMEFMKEVHAVLADDGIWHFEQSYLSLMLSSGSYDTICHEHAEYYALGPIVWMADRVGFDVVDISFNDSNGGSFAVTVAKRSSGKPNHAPVVAETLAREHAEGIPGPGALTRFEERARRHRAELRSVLEELKRAGKVVCGLGASTKGNVILQFCEVGPELVSCIAEVNEDKYGCFTPGTAIPIVSEADAAARKPDVYLVLPWHFRKHIIGRSAALLAQGTKLLFPLPALEFYPSR